MTVVADAPFVPQVVPQHRSSGTTYSVDVARERDRARSALDASLVALCDGFLPDIPAPWSDAIRYSALSHGKRLRGLLVMSAYQAAGGAGDVTPLGAAVEVIHSYSLVHDDLPCMDDDAMRRGRPTTHVVFGANVALVAGTLMLPLAVRAIERGGDALGLDAPQIAIIVEGLLQAAGAAGMIGGQLLDLDAEGATTLSLEALETIHRAKTGALMAASARTGALAAGASSASVDALGHFGAELGLGFQIIDDVLDVTSTTDRLGKTAGRDVALGKSTYPALLGVDGAAARANRYVRGGCETLAAAGLLTPALQSLADVVLTRTN